MADLFSKVSKSIRQTNALSKSIANAPAQKQEPERTYGGGRQSERPNDRPSSVSELSTAITGMFQPATEGPAQIRTPELDKSVGNVRPSGDTLEDANLLARQAPTPVDRTQNAGPIMPERNVGGGITRNQFEQARQQSAADGNPLLAYGRGLISTADNYDTPDGMTDAEARAYQRGLRTQDVAVNLPAIIAEFGEHALDTFLRPTAEHEANSYDPEIVQRASRAGDIVGLTTSTGLGKASNEIAEFVTMVEDAATGGRWRDPLNRAAMSEFDKLQGVVEDETKDWTAGQKKAFMYGSEAVRMVPSIVLAWMTGGASSAATLGPEAAGRAAQFSQAFTRYVTGLAHDPQFYLTSMQVAGDSYASALEKGVDRNTAALFGTLNGVLNGALEVGGMQDVPGLIRGTGFSNGLLHAILSIPTEIREEVMQGAVEKALENVVLGENNQFISVKDPDAIISLSRAVQEGEGAAIISALMGGGNVALNTALNAYNNAAQQQNPLTQTILANQQGQQEQGGEFNAPQSPQGAEQAQGQAGTQPALTTAQSEAQARVAEILSGTMSNSRAESIITDPELRTAFEEMSGVQLTGAKSEQRAAVKEFAESLAQSQPLTPIAQTVLNNEQQNTAQTQTTEPAAPAPAPVPAPAPAPTAQTQPTAQEIQPQETPRGRTAEERAEAERRAYRSERNILQSETPERQAYLTQKRQEHGAFLDGLKTGDKVYLDGESRPAFGVVSASENGMMLEFYDEDGNAYAVERVLPEAFTGDTAISLLETAESTEVRNGQGQVPVPGQLRSQSEANTIQTVDEQQGAPEDVRQEIYYTPVSEEESVAQARAMLENGYEGGVPGRPNTKLTPEQSEALTAAGQRLGGGYGQAIADMQGAPAWTSVQQDMSLLMFNALAEDAKRTGDWSAYLAWRIVDQEHATEIARALQARGKATRGETQDLMDYVADTINSSNMSQSAKDAAMAKTMQFAEEYTNTDKADANALRDLIVRMSDERKTGTVFKKNLEKLLNGQDAEYLAKIAEAQVKGMANDYIPASVGDKVKSWQTIAQLLKITTFARNLGGNETFGFMDALVGNTFGVALDKLVGGKTGARAVGFDPRWFSSTQRKAAVDAMQKSMLEIALDVDMGSVGTKYDPRGRSFRMNGNPAERFASRLSQILSYSLTSSDAFFRGALETGTTETLNRLNAGNEAALSQVEGVAQNRADYALFQNKGKTAQTARAFHDRLNAWIGTGGKVENGRRTGGFGLGDLIMPYATVPANLAIKPFEYSPLGIVKGGIELAKVLKNAQSGNVNLQAQHNAVMEIARGVTGLPVALLFAQLIRNGIVKRSNDDDDYDVTKARQSENRRETQWNLDATLRWLQGGSREWEEGDKLISLNWMEPMNAFMDIGALIADMQEDEDPTLADYLSKYAIGSVQAAMEMPMIDGLQSAIQAMQYADSDNMWEKLGKFGESTVTSAATGMMPGAVSQLARTLDPTTRDTSADTFAGRFANALMNATPVLRERLPEKLDSLGNPITNDNPLLNALNNFILPGQVAEYAPNDVVQALDEVYEATGKSNFYPDYKPPASFSYDDADYKLDTEEKRLYQQTFGNTYEELVRNVTQSAEYDSLTAAEKAAVFSEMRSMATAEAKGAIVEGRGGEYTSDYDKVSELSDIPGYFSTKAMFSTASNEKNRDYERMPEILEAYGSLPEDVKEKLKAGNTSNLDELYDAWSNGVSAENWYKAYDAKADLVPYGDNKSVADWQKYQAMANVSTDEDMDAMLRGYMDGPEYQRYRWARSMGISAKDWADAKAAAGMLEPEAGKTRVSDWQKYQAMAGVLDGRGMDAMMNAELEPNAYDNYNYIRRSGVSAQEWADVMADIGKLEPVNGANGVAEWQKYQVIASASPQNADVFLKTYLSDSAYQRYMTARSAGVPAQVWADANADISRLFPYGENKGVSEWQEYEYITRNYPQNAKELLPYFIDSDGMRNRYSIAMDAGVSPELWASCYRQYNTVTGKDDNGKTVSGLKQERFVKWMVGEGYSVKQAEYMYKLFSVSGQDKLASLNETLK